MGANDTPHPCPRVHFNPPPLTCNKSAERLSDCTSSAAAHDAGRTSQAVAATQCTWAREGEGQRQVG